MNKYRTTILQSFRYAFRGIYYAFRGQRNIWIQSGFGVIAVVLAVILRVTHMEIVLLILISFLVVILEMFNTGFERLIDIISPEYHKEYGKIKDIIAGVVLMSAICSIVVGTIILGPPLLKKMHLIIGK